MPMFFSIPVGLSGLACVLALSACSFSSTPHADARFGQSLRTLQARQTIYPQGAPDRAQLPALSGAVAVRAQQNYQASFAPGRQGPAATASIREQIQ
jgi:uncharacterized lipoprotein